MIKRKRDLAPASPLRTLSFVDMSGPAWCQEVESMTPQQLSSVGFLKLRRVGLFHWPANIDSFCNLSSLDLESNGLTMISEAIGQLPHLFLLILSNNALDEHSFPQNFRVLTSLQTLYLTGNRLRMIPSQITDLWNLHSLRLNSNLIEQVPPSIGKLRRLIYLSLSGNSLRTLPDEIWQLEYLIDLDLSNNKFESIPSAISCLSNLHWLSVSENELKTLPMDILSLGYLCSLKLNGNPLVTTFTPEKIDEVLSLQELAARCTVRSKLPYSEKQLPSQLCSYLMRAKRCGCTKCGGYYLDFCVANISFRDVVDCSNVPLLDRLCSTKCLTL